MSAAAELHRRGSGLATDEPPPATPLLTLRCVVHFTYEDGAATAASSAPFATPAMAIVHLLSTEAAQHGLLLQPERFAAPSACAAERRPGAGSHNAAASDRRIVTHVDGRATTVRAVRRVSRSSDEDGAVCEARPAGRGHIWVPFTRVCALEWDTGDCDDDTVAATRHRDATQFSTATASRGPHSHGATGESRRGRRTPSVVLVLPRCPSDRVALSARAGGGEPPSPLVRLIRLEGLRCTDALVLATAFDSAPATSSTAIATAAGALLEATTCGRDGVVDPPQLPCVPHGAVASAPDTAAASHAAVGPRVEDAAYVKYARLLGIYTAPAAVEPMPGCEGEEGDVRLAARRRTAPHSPTTPSHAGSASMSLLDPLSPALVASPTASPAWPRAAPLLAEDRPFSSSVAAVDSWRRDRGGNSDAGGRLSAAARASSVVVAATSGALWRSSGPHRASAPASPLESTRGIPRWFPPAPEISDVSDTTPTSSRRSSPSREATSPLSVHPTSPLTNTRTAGGEPHRPQPLRHGGDALTAGLVSAALAEVAHAARQDGRAVALNGFHASKQSDSSLSVRAAPPMVVAQARQDPSGPLQPPSPSPLHSHVLGSLKNLTAEQRELINFDQLLMPTTPPSLPPPLPGSGPSGVIAPPTPASAPLQTPLFLRQAILQLRTNTFACHPADPTTLPPPPPPPPPLSGNSIALQPTPSALETEARVAPLEACERRHAGVSPEPSGAAPHQFSCLVSHGELSQPTSRSSHGDEVGAASSTARVVRYPAQPRCLLVGALSTDSRSGDFVDPVLLPDWKGGGALSTDAVPSPLSMRATTRTRPGNGPRTPQTPPRMLPRRPEAVVGGAPTKTPGGTTDATAPPLLMLENPPASAAT
ncbi:hypothetical protein NESM_000457100 [Novymonas esmeraldas]|uniref:Uncharacterized protein n=1 Tax=Novymonas esmeraldas TaxID=1808958 RepID=A0AAW0EMA0_9TRYP